MKMRIIDSTTHELTAPQILAEILACLRKAKSAPIVLVTKRFEGENTIRLVRTELSRARNKNKEMGIPVSYFGFAATPLDIVLKNENGLVTEHYMIQYNVTPLQQAKNLASKIGSGEFDL